MKVIKVQFHKIDKEYYFLPEFTEEQNNEIKIGESVIVKTILGQDLGVITGWADWQPKDNSEVDKKDISILQQNTMSDIKPLFRRVTNEDLIKISKQRKKYSKYLKSCKDLCAKHKLEEMKLVDVHESFDEGRLTFYFIANTRIDFRELVKDLVKDFHKKIRLQQIGVRDAAKIEGDVGSCGLKLCCKSWLQTIGNVSPDYIKDQELSHRGADRLTGVCGRLKCCLRYEEEDYKYNLNKLPQVGEIIKTKAGKGEVITVHALKSTVDLNINGAIVEYPYLKDQHCVKETNSVAQTSETKE